MTNKAVVDASAFLNAILPEITDLNVEHAIQALEAGTLQLHAPQILLHEYGNSLLMALRRGRISDAHYQYYRAAIRDSGILLDDPAKDEFQSWFNRVSDYGLRNDLTFYDACYLELAARLNVPLLTLDGALVRSAQSYDLLYGTNLT